MEKNFTSFTVNSLVPRFQIYSQQRRLYFICFYLVSLFFVSSLKAEDANTVVDGNARFTVLSSTLIRTEYSGDGIFENRNSYNITNLNMPAPSFTTVVKDGWREIQTEKVLLRYKQNSGVFDSTNLVVKLNVQNETVIAKPWFMVTSGYREEAEKARLFSGAKIATDHIDYDGTGFVAGLKTVGAGMEWTPKENWQPGEYILSFKYSNGMGSDRTISLYIDGVKTQILLTQTATWDKWNIFQKAITLDSKPHIFKLVCDDGDNYNVNIDWINISPVLNVNQICEAEKGLYSGGASVATDHLRFSGSGFVAGLVKAGPTIAWNINNNLTAGDYVFSIKYANGIPGDGQQIPRTLSLYVDGVKTQVTFPTTADWDTWSIVKDTIALGTGSHTVKLVCDAGDTYHVNIDWLAISPLGAELPKENFDKIKTNLGAWSRGLDEKKGPIPLWDGILSRDGWYLLDDSQTALQDGEGWVIDRPVHTGGYQDGYFFGYGSDYQTALREFYKITGNPVMLPKWAFGVWYSINDAASTTSAYYQNTLLPQLRSEKVPLDVLVVDTDWKAPYRWNSWDWNKTAFPDPQAFLNWSKQQGLVIPLNLHPTIQGDDAKFAVTNATAGGLISKGGKYHFDFTNKKHAQAYFDLHKPFNESGVRFWWFDQAEEPNSAIAGVPADTWINGLYVKEANDRGIRGFAFSRIGSGHAGYNDGRKPGIAWSEHRYTLHFTGDTYNTWEMLAFQSTFTIKEGNIGIPYVTHDLGSYHGSTLSDDMYMRWVQFGTFQPIFRLHSKQGKRLPWQYPNVSQQAKDFIRLRHALIPYTYTLAHETATGGMPIVSGMYLYYPTSPEAFTYDRQYFYGEKVLVSPIASAGAIASTDVWFPEGKWTNYFTNETVVGPLVKTVSADYSSMPVFVKAGGIIPLAPYSDYVGQTATDSLTLKVYAGADGEFTLYEDEGENLNYQTGKYALTKISYSEQQRRLLIKSQEGTYSGAPQQRSYNVRLYNAVVPEKISINGTEINKSAAGSSEGWWVSNNVICINLNKRVVNADIDIVLTGVETGLRNGILNKNVRIFPNPATELVTIEVGDAANNSAVSIFNSNGEKVFEKFMSNSKQLTINTRKFRKGTYLVKVDNRNSNFTEKLIVK